MDAERDIDGLCKMRNTQRVPKSCTECSRRKIKCTKRIPCEACIRRGDQLSCAREIVRVNGQVIIAVDPDVSTDSSAGYESLLRENEALRTRNKQVEALLSSAGIVNSRQDSHHILPTHDIQVSVEINSTFDGLHLGACPASDSCIQSQLSYSHHEHADLFHLLPIRSSSDRLVRLSLGMLGWVHCALSVPKFLREHENFWNSLISKDQGYLFDHSWMGIYLSVIAVGAYILHDDDLFDLHFIHEAYTPSNNSKSYSHGKGIRVAKIWYNAAFVELIRSDFLTKPSLCTVQTLAILTILHRNFGEANREYYLLGVAINISRTLGMDRLGSESRLSPNIAARPEWQNRAERELGRRLWWTLVICDWITVFSRPSSISADSFATVMSVDHDTSQGDIILELDALQANNIIEQPPPLAVHAILARIAYTIHIHIKDAMKRSIVSSRMALEELDLISSSLPEHLSARPSIHRPAQDKRWPWIPLQRSDIAVLLDVSRINICLSFLPRSTEDTGNNAMFHRRGRDAAMCIVNHRQNESIPLFSKLWGTSATTLAAGIFLVLDLLCSKSAQSQLLQGEYLKQIESIELSISLLSQNDASPADISGSHIITRLLRLLVAWDPSHPVDRQTLTNIMKVVAAEPAASSTNDFETIKSLSNQGQHRSLIHLSDHQILPSEVYHQFNTSANAVGNDMAFEWDNVDITGFEFDDLWSFQSISTN